MKTHILIVLLICGFILGCSSKMEQFLPSDALSGSNSDTKEYAKGDYKESESSGDYEGYYDKSYDGNNEDEPISNEMEIKIPDKLIKTASVHIEVEDYDESIVKIKETVKQRKAYVSDENEINNSYRTGNTLVIRVHKESFELLIEDLALLAKRVDSKNINSLDVSEEYVDVLARLKTKKEVENRYIELLKQARNVDEILHVEDKIRIIREEIEAKEGRLKFMDDRISFSTITLEVYQYSDYKYEPSFVHKLTDAFSGGWQGVKVLFIGLLYLWPMWIILITVLLWLRWFIRKRRRNK